MVRGTWFQSHVASYLTLRNIRYVSGARWSNPEKGKAPFPTTRCSSYWKGSLLVAFDYGHQLYFLLMIQNCTQWWVFLQRLWGVWRHTFVVITPSSTDSESLYLFEPIHGSNNFILLSIGQFSSASLSCSQRFGRCVLQPSTKICEYYHEDDDNSPCTLSVRNYQFSSAK